MMVWLLFCILASLCGASQWESALKSKQEREIPSMTLVSCYINIIFHLYTAFVELKVPKVFGWGSFAIIDYLSGIGQLFKSAIKSSLIATYIR